MFPAARILTASPASDGFRPRAAAEVVTRTVRQDREREIVASAREEPVRYTATRAVATNCHNDVVPVRRGLVGEGDLSTRLCGLGEGDIVELFGEQLLVDSDAPPATPPARRRVEDYEVARHGAQSSSSGSKVCVPAWYHCSRNG